MAQFLRGRLFSETLHLSVSPPQESGTPTELVIEILGHHIEAGNVESSRQFAVYLARRYFSLAGARAYHEKG